MKTSISIGKITETAVHFNSLCMPLFVIISETTVFAQVLVLLNYYFLAYIIINKICRIFKQ